VSEKQRLDRAVEARGLLPSRARARDAILRRTVSVNGVVVDRPNHAVAPTDVITIDDPAARFVSRAALKLVAGLDAAEIDPANRICLDVGASTGGFTQVLLHRGAACVYAVDVGHEQLSPLVAADERVVSLEGVNARDLDRNLIPEPIDLVVCDISFVSVTKVLAAPLALCRPEADAVVLFKPQFEVGRAHVGKGGIVSDRQAMAAARDAVLTFFAAEGWLPVTEVPSPIAGGDGNREIVLVLRRTPDQS
jgi:23S rRNA (cytidine1920-2'-O)/16S rRNA (cytidine1409-2'-O)-methyltransferase